MSTNSPEHTNRERAVSSLLPWLRSSVLLKGLGILTVALVALSAITAVLEARVTGSAVRQQAHQLARSHLSIIEQAYLERERTLLGNLRNLAQAIAAGGLTQPDRENDLLAELGRASRNLDLDLLAVVETRPDGQAARARVGLGLAVPSVDSLAGAGLEPFNRLLSTREGPFVQAGVMPIGSGAPPLLLVGGYEFADEFAYRLRTQVGISNHVILVAEDRVAGSTLPQPPRQPPAADPHLSLPESPAAVSVADDELLVAYAPVGSPPGGRGQSALGVALPDPMKPIQRSLGQSRLFATAVLVLVAAGFGWLLFRALIRPLMSLAKTAARVGAGDLDASFAGYGNDEIGRLADWLERMRLDLRTKLQVIAQQSSGLRETSQRIVAVQDDERRRMARDLHDGIQQQLVVLRMRLGMVRDALQRDPGPTIELFGDLGEEVDGIIERLREVSHDLYPSILADRGLTSALYSYSRQLPLSTHVTCSPDPFPRLPPKIESGAYFLASEAVTNVLKHSGASAIEISLQLQDQRLMVTVADNGRGFDPGARRRSGGVVHMEDRVRSSGGVFYVRSAPGQGTAVVASFPLEPAAAETVRADGNGDRRADRELLSGDSAVNQCSGRGKTALRRPGG